MLDEGLLLAQGVSVGHVAHVEEAVGGMLRVVGEPFPVLLVDAQRDLLEVEDRVHGLEELQEFLQILLVHQLVPPVTRLALGGVDQQVRLGGLYLK